MGFKITEFKNMFSVHFVFESDQVKTNKISMERTYIFLTISWKQIVIFHFFLTTHMFQLQKGKDFSLSS